MTNKPLTTERLEIMLAETLGTTAARGDGASIEVTASIFINVLTEALASRKAASPSQVKMMAQELEERRKADASPVYQFRIRNSYNGLVTEWQTLKNRDDVDFVLKEQPLNSEFRIIGAVPSNEKITPHLETLSRYDLGGHCDSFGQDCGAEMEVCEDGDFVRFCDVEALLKSQFSK